ncbi:MAG: glycosyltransferase family 39 protein [Planctomycetes bacterium]|nr:glycosyltransferase family 39 protein [Planctomycetota bacterium]
MTSPSESSPPPSERDADGRALLSWRDPWVRALVALTLALQFFAWSRIEGYQIADSVEFMEIATSLVRGEERVDADVIRPIGFAFVLTPVFALADWLGLRDGRGIVWCVTLLEILLGAVLVVLTTRIGARVGGRACGLAAGFLVATNPVFLQYSTQPESGIPAGVCLALALDRLIVRPPGGTLRARHALVGGLWLGAAFLIGYKTILISGVLLTLLVLRDRWSHRRTWLAAAAGLGAALCLQSTLDGLMYGSFGASLFNYLAQNAGSVLTSVLLKLHFLIGGGVHGLPLDDPGQPKSFWLLRAADVYQVRTDLTGDVFDKTREISLRAKMHSWWYVTELPTMLAWPAIVLLAVGVVVAIVTGNVAVLIMLVVLVANVAAMSNKGWKEYRLWLPMLPLLMPIAALGFAWVARQILARLGAARRLAAAALLLAIGGLSLRALTALETRLFGGYWVAMDWVNARAAETLPARAAEARARGLREPERLRVTAAYHWAVFRRESAHVAPVKLPWQLNMWQQYAPHPGTGVVREHVEDLSALEEVDLFLVHLPILSENPELLRFVAGRFEVVAAFHDGATYGDLGPIFALVRRSGDPRARLFLEERRGIDPAAFREERGLRGAVDFLDPDDPAGERLELLGLEVREVPPQGFSWITYHWRAPRTLRTDWTLVDRLTAPDERAVWDNGHRGAYGALPTTAWEPGVVVSEGYLLVPAAEPYRPRAPLRPIGGAYRRGDLLPLRSWVGVREYGPLPEEGGPAPVVRELLAARPGSSRPLRPREARELYQTPDGTQFSADGLVRARGLLLPVIDAARLADDGRPFEPEPALGP